MVRFVFVYMEVQGSNLAICMYNIFSYFHIFLHTYSIGYPIRFSGSVQITLRQRSQKLDSAVTIRACGMLKEDTGSGCFSILDYATPFGHDFTKHLGIQDVHEPSAIRVHVLVRQKQVESPCFGYSFTLCGYEKNVWNHPDVMLAMRGQVLHFAKYVQNPQLGKALLRGLENASCLVVPCLDAMNRKHVVLDVPLDLFDFGYVYIHEDEVPKSQAKARAHHHWRFIKEGCDILKGQMVIMRDWGA